MTFVAGVASCGSSLVFYPFASVFPRRYTTALAIGEGLSGSAAGLLGMLQRLGEVKRNAKCGRGTPRELKTLVPPSASRALSACPPCWPWCAWAVHPVDQQVESIYGSCGSTG